MKGALKLYVEAVDEYSFHRGLLLRESTLVVPPSLHSEILQQLHFGHLGTAKCHERASHCDGQAYTKSWMESLASVQCDVDTNNSQPSITSNSLSRTSVAESILRSLRMKNVQVSTGIYITDYYSHYIEVTELKKQTSHEVINHLKSIFARHRISEMLMSDNETQYSCTFFREFATEYGFTHLTSSPNYPQGNGSAERAVKTVKELLKKNKDPYLAQPDHHSTPLENGYSSRELLMGRKLRTIIPFITTQLHPCLSKFPELKNKEQRIKERQRVNFNTRHYEKDLKPLQSGDAVWLPEFKSEWKVVEEKQLRSYTVQ